MVDIHTPLSRPLSFLRFKLPSVPADAAVFPFHDLRREWKAGRTSDLRPAAPLLSLRPFSCDPSGMPLPLRLVYGWLHPCSAGSLSLKEEPRRHALRSVADLHLYALFLDPSVSKPAERQPFHPRSGPAAVSHIHRFRAGRICLPPGFLRTVRLLFPSGPSSGVTVWSAFLIPRRHPDGVT